MGRRWRRVFAGRDRKPAEPARMALCPSGKPVVRVYRELSLRSDGLRNMGEGRTENRPLFIVI